MNLVTIAHLKLQGSTQEQIERAKKFLPRDKYSHSMPIVFGKLARSASIQNLPDKQYNLTGQFFGLGYVDSFAGKGTCGEDTFNVVVFSGPYIGLWFTLTKVDLKSKYFEQHFEEYVRIALDSRPVPYFVVKHDYEQWWSRRMGATGTAYTYRYCNGCGSQTTVASELCEHCGCSGD